MPPFLRLTLLRAAADAPAGGGGATPPADPPATNPPAAPPADAGRFFTLDAKPENLPDGFWTEGKGLNVDALLTHATTDHAAAALAKLREGVPETPAGYEFKPDPAKTKGATVDVADPILTAAREVMHELGAKPEQWAKLTDAYTAAAVAAMPDTAAEKAKLGENADARISAVDMKLAKLLPKEGYEALMHGITTADGILALEKMLGTGAPAGGGGGDGPQVGGGGGGGGVPAQLTPEQAAKLPADPDYHKSNPRGAELRRQFSAFIAAGGVLPGFNPR